MEAWSPARIGISGKYRDGGGDGYEVWTAIYSTEKVSSCISVEA